MIIAINNGKASQNFKGADIDWKDLFRKSEDSLTASIFGRLFYLPVDLLMQILSESCYDKILDSDCGGIVKTEFWPKWNAEETTNTKYIEPDIHIQLKKFDLLIEAKRGNDNKQTEEQWQNQITAYRNEYGDKKLYLIALDGLKSDKSEKLGNVHIIKCTWARLLKAIQTELKELETKELLAQDVAIKNILNDLIIAFDVHGYFTGQWFESIPYEDLKIECPNNILIYGLPNFN
ncbi:MULTISPECIES: hypothetical protein [unclassified Carboxylicivirga]|uniref:hypothetical protein n=1 Tax=Carboxylicivirga TaxID=1628153 RepID=UPI003D35906B